ncbi:hypothetical protein F5890DRAFT_1557635 [Lentinula detonsa]|uniref:Uncharacterized protein n=1 Tax=Lentinula detonsa TaxID=2804962 RepID=A0AA38PRN1_9AGAR|nr:hypothetical protein F5890DRAFT_1557635 [Lentinula detonsa]
MHLRLGLWMTALILGLMHPILGIPTRQGQVMRIKQDPNSPGKISSADKRYMKLVTFRFKPDDSPEVTRSAVSLDLDEPAVRAAKMMAEFVLRSAWKQMRIEPLIRWGTNEAYGVKLPEIVISRHGSLAAGWTPAKELDFSLVRMKSVEGWETFSKTEFGYVKPVPKEEGLFQMCVAGSAKTVKMDLETLKELRQLVPFEWPEE